MAKRNSYLDVMKFLFSIIIILYHTDVFFFGGYIVVEAFFMISGYFMMKSLGKSNSEDSLGVATASFVAKKYKSIIFFLIPSAIIGCIAYIYIMPRDTKDVILQAVLMIFELAPMQVAGFTGFYTTGVAWYLSAMLLSLLIVYPLARKFKDTFSLVACPLASVLIYGFLMYNAGNMDVPNSWINNMFNTGLLRGVAGLSAGCFLYECAERLSERKVCIGSRIFFTLLEIAGWGYCVYIMHEYPKSMYDAALIFIMFGLLLIGINRYSLLSCLIQFKWTRHLATVSTVVYLNHYYWSKFLTAQYPQLSQSTHLALYLALIAVSSALVYGVGRLMMYIWDSRAVKKQSV